MAFRAQVILDEKEAAKFKNQARKESKSLSAWLREAGNKIIEIDKQKNHLKTREGLRKFFQNCNKREKGKEPDWREHKHLIEKGFKSGEGL